MSETQTAERIDEDNLVDAARRGEQDREAKQLDVANPAATGFAEFQLAVRRMLGLEDASEGEMRLFWHLCQKSGLDPFNREIYMIGRNTEVGSYEPVNADEPDGPKRKVMRWVTKYTVQVAINGFRKRAREIADGKGVELEMGEPLWCGEDGVWREVWPEKTAPTASKFTVYRDSKPFTFVAHHGEYVQYTGGGEPTSMWKKMPRNQIRKCAEANAIQMAFPDELGGLILEDAAQPDLVVDQDGNIESQSTRRRPGGAGVDGMRVARERREAERQQRADIVDAEETADPGQDGGNDVGHGAEPSFFNGANDSRAQDGSGDKPMSEATRRKWIGRMFQLLSEGDCSDRDDQLIVITGTAHAAGHPGLVLDHRDELTDGQLRDVVGQLNKWSKDNALGHEITELLNAAALKEMETETETENNTATTDSKGE